MRWFRISFEHAIVHCVSQDMLMPLIADMAAREHPLKNFEKEYGINHARALGDNPKQVDSWWLDMGGPFWRDEPIEKFDKAVRGLSIEVASDHLRVIANDLDKDRKRVREFADGTSYIKLKTWNAALVLSVNDAAHLAWNLGARQPTASRRAAEFFVDRQERTQPKAAQP